MTQTAGPSREARERAAIDTSTRFPVLLFYASALFWLFLASLISLITSIKLHYPGFLSFCAALNFGRLVPVQNNLMFYGWASLAGVGTAIWIMARLCRVELRYPLFITFGAALWNLGLIVGTIAILAGAGGPFPYLEFPGYAAVLIFLGYSAIGIWGVVLYRFRRSGHVFVSQWYLICAFFAFPWIYAIGNLMLHVLPVEGAVQSAIVFWFAGNLFGLWLTAIGLAAAYYMIPKVTGLPIFSYHLATFGFWTFVLFYSFRGLPAFLGGPLPSWVITASIVASVLTIIPIATVAVNHHFTLRQNITMMHFSPTLRFVVIGAMAYTLAGCLNIIFSLRSAGHFMHLTMGARGLIQLDLYAFFSMVMFGCIYYIVPRLVGVEWRSAWLIKLHFWGAAYGIGLLLLMLLVGGLMQGAAMMDPGNSFEQVYESTLPFLAGSTIAQVLLFFGQTVFGLHFLMMLARLGRPGGAPTLIVPQPAEVAH